MAWSRPPEGAQIVQPLRARGTAQIRNTSNERRADGPETHELENVPLQTAQAVRAEIPAIDRCGHAHCDDDASALAAEKFHGPLAEPERAECKAGAHHLFEQRLEQCRHGAEPQRIEDDDVVCPTHEVLALPHAVHGLAFVIVRLRT